MSKKWNDAGGISETFWTADKEYAFQRVGNIWNLYSGDEGCFEKEFPSFVELQLYIWQSRDKKGVK